MVFTYNKEYVTAHSYFFAQNKSKYVYHEAWFTECRVSKETVKSLLKTVNK